MIPLYGFLETDTIGLLIFAYPEDTIETLIQKLQNSAAIRVKPQATMSLRYKDTFPEPHATVLETGFQPLDHFFVVHGTTSNV